MSIGIIFFFISVSIIALIIGIVKKNKKVIVTSSMSLLVFLMLGFALYMALGAM